MSICGIHGMRNNKYGYCRGCEEDSRIQVKHCVDCRKPFAVSVSQTARDCQACAVKKAMAAGGD